MPRKVNKSPVDSKTNVPIFEANLFQMNEAKQRPNSSIAERSFTSQNGQTQSQTREKALLYIKVNFGEQVQSTGVYREDTANIIAERLIKQSGLYAEMT